MNIGIYNPYLDSFGGGERYCLALALHWSKKHAVSVFWNDQNIRKGAKSRLNIDLSKVKIVHDVFRGKNVFKKIAVTREYDLLFFLSDGSIPLTLAKSNILHFQNPFVSVKGRSLRNTLKLRRFNTVVCNSHFTKEYIDREYGVESFVIYPPVTTNEFQIGQKENIIVSVGRFSTYAINKKQKEMVQFFKNFHKQHGDWKLYLIGGLLPQDRDYFDEVKRLANGMPIYLFPNELFANVKKYYSQAKIYWHAAGYGEDVGENPAAMEHFGISTVEAMASGCVPIVYDGGGQAEIVKHGIDGILWKTEQELLDTTARVVLNEKLRVRLQESAVKRAGEFNQYKFNAAFDRIITK